MKGLALEALYGVHRADIMRFLIARTGDPTESEDILQDLWIKARSSAAAPTSDGRAYLFRMAQNLIVDRLRERQRRMRRDRRWSEERQGPGTAEPVDLSGTAEEAMIDAEEVETLRSALETLPEGARKAFELHKLHGMSHAQVSERLGISRSGVEKHMAVAMKYLRRALLD